jgi:general secretion pathway protein G
MKNKRNRGFTLIELLVVIAIIAILSTVVMAGLNSARMKGRDAKRLSDIKQVQAALELYTDSCSGYPGNAAGALAQGTADGGPGLGIAETDTCPAATTFGTYMAQVPANPGPGGDGYNYCGTSNNIPTTGEDDLSATECGGAVSRVSYLIGFQLEAVSGSIQPFEVTAGPAGLVGGGPID